MSLFLFLPTATANIYSLAGESISEVVGSPTSAEAILQFRRDGTVWKETAAGGEVQIDSATDWILPANQTATIGDNYQVRYIDSPSSAFTVDDLTLNTWTTINATLKVGYSSQIGSALSSGSITFQLRRAGGGAILAEGEYSMVASST